jgi:hypothetical protein
LEVSNLGAKMAMLGASTVVTFAPVIPTLWQFTTMSTAMTVGISGVAGSLLIANLALLLADFHRPVGFQTQRKSLAFRRLQVSVVLCLASIGLAFFLNYILSNVPISISNGGAMFQSQGMLRFQAGFQIASEVIVPLPVKVAPTCQPMDSKEPDSAATIRMTDINSPNPYLKFLNFRHPQIVFVLCNEPVTVEQIEPIVLPATVEVFHAARRETWRISIFIFGVILCVCNLVYVFRR